MTLLYKADPVRGGEWQAIFAKAAPDVPFRIWPDVGAADEVRYLAAWQAPPELVASLPNLEVLFSLGAGVDQFDLAALPPQVSLVRLVEPGIIAGMVEYAVSATLALHRQIPAYLADQRAGRWAPRRLVMAQDRRVGVMGLGELGRAVLAALAPFGFPLSGWSRSEHQVEGVECFSGTETLPAFLQQCDILICLLPLTAATRGILCRQTFENLPRGAGLVNVGRGGHLVEADLVEALDNGWLSAAVLDVLNEEPPPADHPFFSRTDVILTPHIAAMTHPRTAALVLLENLRRHQRDEPMRGLVPRDVGY